MPPLIPIYNICLTLKSCFRVLKQASWSHLTAKYPTEIGSSDCKILLINNIIWHRRSYHYCCGVSIDMLWHLMDMWAEYANADIQISSLSISRESTMLLFLLQYPLDLFSFPNIFICRRHTTSFQTNQFSEREREWLLTHLNLFSFSETNFSQALS